MMAVVRFMAASSSFDRKPSTLSVLILPTDICNLVSSTASAVDMKHCRMLLISRSDPSSIEPNESRLIAIIIMRSRSMSNNSMESTKSSSSRSSLDTDSLLSVTIDTTISTFSSSQENLLSMVCAPMKSNASKVVMVSSPTIFTSFIRTNMSSVPTFRSSNSNRKEPSSSRINDRRMLLISRSPLLSFLRKYRSNRSMPTSAHEPMRLSKSVKFISRTSSPTSRFCSASRGPASDGT
mmetsp:Transcript_5118/g.13715  ORF Transcript_5118/g.13715 Transcript_5118/m.13715 type:complete len:237 (+) Transcript_5118:3378-4088(+)